MAKDKPTTGTERLYTIPLRHSVRKTPAKERANRSARTIKIFLSRHTKADEVKISPQLNELIWKRGAKSPPPRVRVKISVNENIAMAMLPDEAAPKKEEKKKEKSKATGIMKKVEEMRNSGMASSKDEKKEEKADAKEKVAEKAEISEKPKKE